MKKEVYTEEEIRGLIAVIDNLEMSGEYFKRSADLFAIRNFLGQSESISRIVFNEKLKAIIRQEFGENYFVVKSIYFDKPASSNWFVSYHQDLTISVDKKADIPGFGPWTAKHGYYGVQAPVEILENIFTIRIHLDDTNEDNGALKVIPQTHRNGVRRMNDLVVVNEVSCNVPKGGIMLMKPLLMHRSSRSKNEKRRRVIHIEFSDMALPGGLHWAEYMDIGS